MKIKRLLQLSIVLTLILTSSLTNAQVRSTFASPTSPTHYSSGTAGICGLCSITNPENAADLSGTNYASFSVPAGVAGSVFIRLKLTTSVSSGNTVGVMIDKVGGLVSSLIQDTYTIKTYSSGVLQDSVTGSNLTAQLEASSTTFQSIHFTSTSAFDEVEFVISSLAAAVNVGDIYYGYGHSSALPVELVSFYGSAAGEQIVLNWQTASEMNNSHFNIEKIAGKNVEVIGAVAGQGNSVNLESYEFVDYSPTAGGNFYRLTQVDYDGTATKTKTISVFYGKTIKKVTITSDYVNQSLRVSAEGGGSVELLNSRGEVVSTHHCESEINIDLSHLQNGVYWVKVTQLNGEVCTEKIVKM